MAASTDLRLTGDQLRRLRGALGLTQDDLATLSLVSRATISGWENQADKLMPENLPARTVTAALLRDELVTTKGGTIYVRIPTK